MDGKKFKLKGEQFEGLHSALATDGGFTVHPGTGKPRKKGIAVATEANEMRVDRSETSPGMIEAYHGRAENQERFARGASLGGWRSDAGDDFLDTPTVYPETPGGQARARNQMLKSDQIASYHIAANKTELNPFHVENKRLDIASSDDSIDQQAMWSNMPRNMPPNKGRSFKPALRPQSFS